MVKGETPVYFERKSTFFIWLRAIKLQRRSSCNLSAAGLRPGFRRRPLCSICAETEFAEIDDPQATRFSTTLSCPATRNPKTRQQHRAPCIWCAPTSPATLNLMLHVRGTVVQCVMPAAHRCYAMLLAAAAHTCCFARVLLLVTSCLLDAVHVHCSKSRSTAL